MAAHIFQPDGYNKELKAKGYIVVAGKISTKFLAEKIYGMKVED